MERKSMTTIAVGTLDFETHAENDPNFSGANLSDARIMARLTRANMQGAILTAARFGPPEPGNELKTPQQTDLSGANLERANLQRADMTRVNLNGANLTSARGLETVRGLEKARNRDKAIF
jgi:uncharacterized protein YjbI with pentapeptide repeats